MSDPAMPPVLIVEDQLIPARVATGLFLARINQKPHWVLSGEEALDLLCQPHDFKLVLMDLGLPNISGYEVIEKVRAYEAANDIEPVTIYALTSHKSPEAIARVMNCGANGHIGKPISPDNAEQLSTQYLEEFMSTPRPPQ